MNINALEDYAHEYKVPIMLPDGINYLTSYIKDNNVKEILEIGTAIGYSSIKMALVDKDIHITTIERNMDMYNLAIKNIKDFGLDKQIKVVLGDALEVEIIGKYDLIFIDAAKAQNIKFFNKYSLLLKDTGTIITDNINFHGLTKGDESTYSRNLRSMIRKIREYIKFLQDNPDYQTKFLDIGDGLAVTKKR
jgi:predicted O-methyltransferase YrrM